MNFTTILITFFSFFISSKNTDHKYYSSITEIELDTDEKLAKIHIQLFGDDVFKLFEDRFSESPSDFNHLNKREQQIFQKYLIQKFKLSTNRNPVDLTYLGIEEKNNLLHIYLEGSIQRKPMRIEISNRILQDVFSEQTNIIHIYYKNLTKSVHLTNAKNNAIVFFDEATKAR